MPLTLNVQSFVRPVLSDVISRVSTTSSGFQTANGSNFNSQISADGRYVVFASDATNVVSGDSNNKTDIFRKDLQTGTIVLVSAQADGMPIADEGSSGPQISADGRYVLFKSDATNLVAGDTNGNTDIFRKDLLTGALIRVSTASDGSQIDVYSEMPQFGPDGNSVIFSSDSDLYVAGDANGASDIFLKNLVTELITCLSTASDGTMGNDYSFDPRTQLQWALCGL